MHTYGKVETLNVLNMLEVLSAACLAWRVEWEFEQTGGIFLCAPPGHLKTQMLLTLEDIPYVKGVSDMTTQDLKAMHAKIEAKDIRTLLFYELPKIYERRSETSSNILGHLRSLIDEGFTGLANEAQGIRSRCVLIAAMPLKFLRDHTQEWQDNGLMRRVLVCRFRLFNPEVLKQAIIIGKKIRLNQNTWIFPSGPIPLSVDMGETKYLDRLLKDQDDGKTQLIMLRKIVSVLRAKNRALHRRDNAMELVEEFAKALRREGVEVVLPEKEEQLIMEGLSEPTQKMMVRGGR